MKVKVIKDAFYQKRRLKDGDVIDFEGDKLPSWAKPIAQNKIVKSETVVEEIESQEIDLQDYSAMEYKNLLKLANDRNIELKSKKAVDVINALIAADLGSEKSETELKLEGMTDSEIILLAKKNLGCTLDVHDSNLVQAYLNAEKVFQKKED